MKPNHWSDLANCRGTYVEEFYPSGPDAGGTVVLKTVQALCRDCPVKDACRVASVPEHWGFWAGLGQVERRKMRRAVNYVPPDMDKDIGRFHRAADRGFAEGNMHTALSRLLGQKRAAVVLGWR